VGAVRDADAGYLRRFTVAYYLQALVPHAMPADEGITSLLRSVLTDTHPRR
jgi:hypothetical protein